MKELQIFDIDDTVFFANQSVIVLGSDGKPAGFLTMEQFKQQEQLDSYNPRNYSWSVLEDADDFIATLKPNPIVIKQLINDLEAGKEVLLVTARTSVNDVEKFKSAFHLHGMKVDRIIFAGDNNPGHKTTLNKKIEFEKLFQQHYDHITIYDDRRDNLEVFYETSLDYPFTSISLRLIDSNGAIHKYFIS